MVPETPEHTGEVWRMTARLANDVRATKKREWKQTNNVHMRVRESFIHHSRKQSLRVKLAQQNTARTPVGLGRRLPLPRLSRFVVAWSHSPRVKLTQLLLSFR